MLDLWSNEDFKCYIKDNISDGDRDHKDAALWYMQMDNLVRDRAKMEGIEKEEEKEFTDPWPVELERRFLLLVSTYIRKDHAKLSEKFLSRFSCNKEEIIPPRLYRLVVDVSIGHGENFEYIIKNLKQKVDGFGIDRIHPRFAACMLRLGDVLDIDNNRFNIRAIDHYGTLPWSSHLHLMKHKAICHILISTTKIEAEASSGQLEVCRLVNEQFKSIDTEVTNLICYWSDMVPEDLGGCIMKKAECKVYHPAAPIEFSAKYQKRFEVDKNKLTDLLIGINIYDAHMDFLREYIQNALDATKMKIWLDLKTGKYEYLKNKKIINDSDLAPFDLSQKIYDQYAIELKVDLNMKTQKVVLIITDKGIGMEEACIDVISRIGSGWRGRESYRDEVPTMLKWLKPTGGFGIGVQSAFMVTDSVTLETKTDFENNGHNIVLNSPTTTGDIIEQSGGNYVKVEINVGRFYHWNDEKSIGRPTATNVQDLIGRINYSDSDIFDKNAALDYVIEFLKTYIEKIVANSFIPIRIINSTRKPVEIKSAYIFEEDYWLNSERYKEYKFEDSGWDYRCIYDIVKNSMVVWNSGSFVYTYIKRVDVRTKASEHVPCLEVLKCVFKVKEDEDVKELKYSLIQRSIDFKDVLSAVNYLLTDIHATPLFLYDYSGCNKITNHITISEKLLIDWCEMQNSDSFAELFEDWEEYLILNALKKCDYTMIRDEAIVNMLVSSGKFEMQTISFSTSGNNSEDKKIIMLVAHHVEEEQVKMDEREFYQKVFYGADNNRYIALMPDALYYEKLLVKSLPYAKYMTSEGPYLISPVNESIRSDVLLELGINRTGLANLGVRLYPYDEFLQTIVDDDSFKSLIQWVYDNQLSQCSNYSWNCKILS